MMKSRSGFAIGLLLLVLGACAAGARQYTTHPCPSSSADTAAGLGSVIGPQQQLKAQENGRIDVTGVWRGESSAECAAFIQDPARCGAVNDITFTLMQEDEKVRGLYKCGYGNMNCRNENQTGKVALGTMGTGLLQMRVMMPDGSDCIFNGRPRGDSMNGSYLCLQGGGLVERGIWRARRSY